MPGNKLSSKKVNKMIQSKFCKVVTDYGEATGFFIDDEQGMLLSSFHLLGEVRPVKYPITSDLDLKIMCILASKGFLDNELRFTTSFLEIYSRQQLNLVLEKEENLKFSTLSTGDNFKITVNLKELMEIINNAEVLKQIIEIFQNKKIGELYPVSTLRDLNLLRILSNTGYLDQQLCITQLAVETKTEQQLKEQLLAWKLYFMTLIGDEHQSECAVTLNDVWEIKNNLSILDAVSRFFQANPVGISFPLTNELCIKMACILWRQGYLNEQFRLTPLAEQIKSIEDIETILERPVTLTLKNFTFKDLTITVSPLESLEINNSALVHETLNNIILNKYDIAILSETIEVLFDDQRLIGKVHFPQENGSEIKRNYAFFDTVPIQITHFEDGTIFGEDARIIDTGDKIEPLPEDMEIKVGEKVYFGGYPLTQQEYTFSTGMVSAVNIIGKKKEIVLQAPITPGNSGSLAFVQRKGKIYWIGAISSEVARVSEKILKLRDQLHDQEEVLAVGTKAGSLGLVEIARESIGVLLDNLSTGRGKVIELRNIESLYDPHYLADQFNLFPNRFLDFLVPKKIRKLVKKKISLYEFVHHNNGTLTHKNLFEYIRDHADLTTRRSIFRQFGSQFLGGYIVFPVGLTEDLQPNNINDQDITSNDRPAIRNLYRFAYLISQNLLNANQYQFTEEDILVHEKHWVTHKFFDDHVAGKNKVHQKQSADAVLKRRSKIPVSSTVKETEIDDIAEEVSSSQDFYKVAYEELNNHSLAHAKAVRGTFFQTKSSLFSLETRYRGGAESSGKSSFFYSVAKKDNKYYMHHFADKDKKNGWQELPIKQKEDVPPRILYYEWL